MLIKTGDCGSICSAKTGADILTNILKGSHEFDRDKEHFWVLGLDNQNVIRYIELVSLGTLDAGLVGTRETFRMAILKGAKNILCAHNHPSGKLEGSEQDDATCRRLRDAGDILGIRVLDFLILDGKYGYLSYREHNHLLGEEHEWKRTK